MSTHMQAEADLYHARSTIQSLGHLLSNTIRLDTNGSYYIELIYEKGSLKEDVADPMFLGGTMVTIKEISLDNQVIRTSMFGQENLESLKVDK